MRGNGVCGLSPVFGSLNEYRAIAYNAAGDAQSSEVVAISPILEPNRVLSVSAWQLSGSSHVGVGWNENSHNEDGFRIERRVGGGTFAQVGIVNANETVFSDTTSRAGIRYEYRILAFNSHGDSLPSDTIEISVLGVPNAPSSVSLSQDNETNVTIRWTDNSDNEDGFAIFRSEGSGNFLPKMIAGENETSVVDNRADVDTSYRYQVVAFNIAGDSSTGTSDSITVTNNAGGGGNVDVIDDGGERKKSGGGAISWVLLVALVLRGMSIGLKNQPVKNPDGNTPRVVVASQEG